MKRISVLFAAVLALLAFSLSGCTLVPINSENIHIHNFVLVSATVNPTAEHSGEGLYRCSCGREKTDKIPAVGYGLLYRSGREKYSITGYRGEIPTTLVLPAVDENGNALTHVKSGAFRNSVLTRVVIDASLTVESGAFKNATISMLYYGGSVAQYNANTNGNFGPSVIAETGIFFYSEERPTDLDYRYWHYDTSGNLCLWDAEEWSPAVR